MNWNNISLIVLGLAAFFGAFVVALWVSLVIWTFRDMRARTRDAFAQLLASLMVLVLGPFGIVLYFILRPRETLAEKYERSLEEEALLQDIEERTICPGCKQPIEPDYVLCPICHTRLRHPCIHCGRLIHPRWSVCPYCAQSQRPVPGVERAGRVTLLDLEREETPPPATGEPSDGAPEPDQVPVELTALASDRMDEQLPAQFQEEPSADAPGVGTVSSWEPPSLETTDPLVETEQVEAKTTNEGATQRPLSLFGRR
jgi:RNA polymerase subunit RPABC4/transcription elongation factor Spt4